MLGAALVFATLLLYIPVLHHDFLNVWDDDVYITKNVHIRSGLTWANVAWAFTTLKPFYWQPLTLLSHMADCQFFGLNSGAHHYINVLLHAANVLLLFLLLQRATGTVWRSFLVAALFAVHSTNVETVAWAAERNNLLNAFFTLVTVAVYGWYVRRPGWRRYLAVVAVFSLASMSKPVAVIVPAILLLLDYWPLKRDDTQPFLKRWGWLLLEKVPLILIGFGTSALTMAGEQASATLLSLSALPVSTRIENAAISYVAYIGKILWPVRLSPFYPHPVMTLGTSLPLGDVAASALILAAITFLVIHLRRKQYALMGWLFFLATLVPMIGIVQTGFQARQDHFTYIPCIGLFIFLVWSVGDAIESMPIAPVVPLLGSLCLLTGYAAVTVHYLQYWQNSVTLFGRALAVADAPNPWLEQLYGIALSDAGRTDEALQHYKASCALGPGNEYCHYFIAEILFDRRQFSSAVEEYQRALMLTGKRDLVLMCLNKSAEALLEMGDDAAANAALVNALKIDPNNATALALQERSFQPREAVP